MSDNSSAFHGDGGEQQRLVWMPTRTGGTWVLVELKYARPSRRERRRGPDRQPHRPVTRHR